MSNIDDEMADQEKQFLRKLAHTGRLNPDEIKQLRSAEPEEIEKLAEKLSSKTAKKVFLLTIATVAKADLELSRNEVRLLEQMTHKLQIGRVKTKEMSYEACESMVLKLLSESFGSDSETTDSGEKFSDLDML